VDADLQSALRGYLHPAERLRWSGRPAQGLQFSARDIFLVPFSLFWGTFAIAWEVAVVASGAPALFTLFGVPFMLIGVYLIAGRFVLDAWVRGRTVYGVTDQRAILLRRLRGERLLTAPLTDPVRMQVGPGGRGTIEIGQQFPLFWRGRGWGAWTPSLDDRVRFIGIDDAKSVYRLLAPEAAAA
jgi:hypothetical protein